MHVGDPFANEFESLGIIENSQCLFVRKFFTFGKLLYYSREFTL